MPRARGPFGFRRLKSSANIGAPARSVAMGLGGYIVEGLLREHRYRPVSGSVVQIGRQTIAVTLPDLSALFTRYGLPLDAFHDSEIEIDHQTTMVRQTEEQFVSDRFFFGVL